jgi:crotonobetainyl-CoA:carnitine CoA-transferase CaiB-like acyl-CoA transferase
MTAGPLQGIRVIECGGYLSAPTAGYMLGDLGAEIIKIEDRIKGDPARGMSALFGSPVILTEGANVLFDTANRGKKSMTIDLKKDKGKDLLYRLLKVSDVFCTNLSQAAIAELGIDYGNLRRHNPRLIYGLATGYGTEGPDAKKRAFDSIAQARSGIMYAVGGDPNTPPEQIGGPIFDQMTGTLLAYGILAALVSREKTGVGQQVDVSLLGSGIHLQAYNLNIAFWRNRAIPKPSRKTLRNPLANHYECADGEWLMFSEGQSDRFWPKFCDALGIQQMEKDPRFATSEERKKNFREITAVVEQVFKTKPRSEWIAILDSKGGGVAFAPVMKPTELASDPQVLQNGYVVEVEHPSLGKVKMVGNPVGFSGTPGSIEGRAPFFGENTEEVLLDVCGCTWEDIEKLKDEEVI